MVFLCALFDTLHLNSELLVTISSSAVHTTFRPRLHIQPEIGQYSVYRALKSAIVPGHQQFMQGKLT